MHITCRPAATQAASGCNKSAAGQASPSRRWVRCRPAATQAASMTVSHLAHLKPGRGQRQYNTTPVAPAGGCVKRRIA